MKKVYVKLAFLTVMLLAALAAVVTVTYAFFILSTDPVMNGITVTLGGGNTVLLAPDLTETVDGALVHYPGEFTAKLDLNACESYAYLNSVGTLRPVSTADGIHWAVPVYDPETGALAGFAEDAALLNANLGAGVEGGTGRYVYMDLWIVSPGADYAVRVSMDRSTGEGSFLTALPGVTALEDGTLTLGETSGSAAAMARVGFLVNGAVAGDAAMQSYTQSAGYDGRFRKLTGVYPEPGEESATGNFTIYEPNGTLHRGETDGIYSLTAPLEKTEEGWEEADVQDRLAVQLPSQWLRREGQTLTELEIRFQETLAGTEITDPAQAEQRLYGERLQGQVNPLVQAGPFFRDTAALYAAAQENGVSGEALAALDLAGAADSAVIAHLKANVPQRIRVFLWLEGQDPDAVNAGFVPGERIALRLELAGGSE